MRNLFKLKNFVGFVFILGIFLFWGQDARAAISSVSIYAPTNANPCFANSTTGFCDLGVSYYANNTDEESFDVTTNGINVHSASYAPSSVGIGTREIRVYFNGSGLVEGTYSLGVNYGGDIDSISGGVVIDNYPLSIYEDSVVTPTNDNMPLFTGYVLDDKQAGSIFYKIDSGSYGSCSDVPVGDGKRSDYTCGPTSTLSEGSHTVYIRAYDAAGNETNSSGTTFTVDTTPPDITLNAYTTTPTNQDVVVIASTNEGTLNTTTHTFTSNGSFDFVATDAAGNVATRTVNITNIDKTPPTATFIYDTTSPTNGNVVATIQPSEAITVTNNSGATTKTFTSNGTFTFNFTDAAGNTGTADATVSNIDKTPPTAYFTYTTTSPTNNDVIATIVPSETVTITNNSGATTKTFSANGSFTFNFTDAAGNTGTADATVSNIDKTPPTATFIYDTTSPTNGNVVATIQPSEAITVTNNSGATTKTFTSNGTFTFNFTDAAGNTGTADATVSNIDKTPPTAYFTYTTTSPTNNDVIATIVPSETVTITNNSGATTKTFSANGSFTFNFTDAAGNTGTADATVSNIDKTPPTAYFTYTTTSPTNSDVIATIVPSETVAITNNSGATTKTFSANGSFTFNFTDAAGNTGTADATVSNIDKTPPTAMVSYDVTVLTNGNVIATIAPSESVTITNNGGLTTHTFTANGTFTFDFTDAAGNLGSAMATVSNIDKTPPAIILTGSSPVTVEYGTTYTDAGATASDNVDGNITANIVKTGSINTNTLGAQYLYYNVSDAANNAATEVIRTVNVTDTVPPVVDAGTDKVSDTTISQDATVTGAISFQWTKDSGPGNITFGSATTEDTTIVADTDGVYVIKLTATDEASNSTSDYMSYTRTTTVPVVNAGIDKITNTSVFQDATVTDASSYSWTKVSGPGTITFSNPNEIDTNISASTEGDYVLRLTATDIYSHSVSDDINFKWDVTPPNISLDTYNTASTNQDIMVTASTNEGLLNNITHTFTANGSFDFVATDAAGNIRTRTVEITNIDKTAPAITLSGSSPVTVEYGATYTDAGATASDNVDGDITANIVKSGLINTNTLGAQYIYYNVSDAATNAAVQVTRTVNVIDTTKPSITLLGSSPVTVEYGATYTDAGATASDNVDGNITANIVKTGSINTNTLGAQYLYYDVSDAATNAATQVTRTVNVVDTTKPVITLLGTSPITVEQNSVYTDAGVTATDNVDGNLTGSVSTSNPVNTSILGSYTVTYNVTDSSSNSAIQVTRTVNVSDTIPPVVDAGTDKTSNTTVSQDATVSGATTYSWTKDSGPGTITFGSATSEDTTISADTDGTYVIRLTASDASNNSASDTMTFIRDTQAPTVDAGFDAFTNSMIFQNATVSGATTFVWSKVSGPGTITFGTPTEEDTNISADTDGLYVLRLTATDAVGNSASDTMNFTWSTAVLSVDTGADVVARTLFSKNATTANAVTYAWSKVSGPGTITFGTPNTEDTNVSANVDGSYVIRLTVTDIIQHTTFDEFNLTWDTVPPTVDAGIDKIANGTISQVASVSGATSYSWTKDSGTGNIIFGSATAKDTTISADTDGIYVIRLSATDDAGNSASDTMSYTRDTVLPVVNAGPDVITKVSSFQNATVTGATTYAWSKVSGPGTINFSSPNMEDTMIDASLDGVYTLRLTATDELGNFASDDISFTWDTNPPTITITPYNTNPTNQDITVTASTDEGSLNTTTHTFTDNGSFDFIATDAAGNQATKNVNITNIDKIPPTVDAGVDIFASAPVTQNATVSGAISYQWSKVTGPGNIIFGTPNTEDTSISADANGVYVARLTAYDAAGNFASDDVSMTWSTAIPTAEVGVDVNTNAVFTKNAVSTNATTYQWSKVSGPGTITFGSPTSKDTTISADVDGSYVIKFTATDVVMNSAQDTFNLVWDTQAPVVNAGVDATTNGTVAQNATVNGATSYLWTKDSGTGNITFGSATSEDTTITADADGTYIIRLTATDAAGNSNFDTITFTRNTAPPAVNAGSDVITKASSFQNATVSGAVTYQWSKVSGPGVITFSSPLSEDTMISASVDGAYVLKLTAFDALSNSANDDINFTWDTTAPSITIDAYTLTPTNQDITVTASTNEGTLNTLTHTFTANGSFDFIATDTAGNSKTETVTISNIDKAAPVVDAGVDEMTNGTVTQNATVSGAVTYLWTKDSGAGNITFGTANAEDTTITADTDGVYVIRLTATDAAGNSASDTLNFTRNTVGPLVNAGVDVDTKVQVFQNATVTGATSYLWSKVSGPGVVTFSSPNSEDTLISADTDGQYVIRLTATNALGNSSVDNINFTWDTTSPIVTVDPYTSTPTNQDISVTVTTNEGTLNTAVHVFIANGSFDFVATDAAGNVTTKNINITNIDKIAPTINAGADRIATTTITQVAVTSGADIYLWSKVSGPGNIIFGTADASSTTIAADADGDYVIKLTGTDNAGNSSEDTFLLVVETSIPVITIAPYTTTPTNQDIIVTASTNEGTLNSESHTFTANGAFDFIATDAAGNSKTETVTISNINKIPPTVNVGGDILAKTLITKNATTANATSYQWSKVSGPGVITFSSSTAEATTISADHDGAYVIKLTVTDSFSNTAEDSFNLNWDTTAPVVNAGPSVGEIQNQTKLNATSDGDSNNDYLWSQISGPGSVAFSTSNAILTPQVQADKAGDYSIMLTATDKAGNMATSTTSFIWSVPRAITNGGGGGGGVINPASVSCTSVSYAPWNGCINESQSRDIISRFPDSCRVTLEQESAKNRTCVAYDRPEVSDTEIAPSTPDINIPSIFTEEASSILSKARNSFTKNNSALVKRLNGQLLLQVESKGEVWYVNPLDKKKYYLGRPESAFAVMRILGVGMTDDNLNKIPVGLMDENLDNVDTDNDGLPDRLEKALGTNPTKIDTDGDGFSDSVELKNNYDPLAPGRVVTDSAFTKQMEGRIFIQVESHGEAWYVNPDTDRRYYLGRPAEAAQIMTDFSTGISDKQLNEIPVGRFTPAQLTKISNLLK